MVNRLALVLAALLPACQPAATAEPPLAGARIGGPFALVDQNGRPTTDRSFAGKYRIVYFGYTFCPDVCPVDVARLVQGYRAFARADPAKAARVVPIFVSVDPARDTPAVLKEFTGAFDPRLVGLTGTPAAVAQAAKGYGVAYRKVQTPGASGYLIDHARIAYLMGPDGAPIALLPQEGTPEEIAAELDRWVA